MDIGYIFTVFQYITNKHQSGSPSPLEFQNSFNLAQIQYQQELIEIMIGWDSNRKKIRLPMANAKQVKQKLAPFIVRGESVAVPGDGRLVKPEDMESISAMRMIGNVKRVKRVEEERITSNYSSTIDPVTTNPMYIEYADYYQIYPVTIGAINWEYIKAPPPVVYGYDIVNGRPVYNAGTSVQPVWSDGEISNLLIRVLFMFGISIQAQNLTSYYNEVKNNGE